MGISFACILLRMRFAVLHDGIELNAGREGMIQVFFVFCEDPASHPGGYSRCEKKETGLQYCLSFIFLQSLSF